jgi:ribosomal protein S20
VANIKSQIKRNKQNEKRHERNKAVKTNLKSAVRKFRTAAEAGDKEAALVAGRDTASPRAPRRPLLSDSASPPSAETVWS